MHQRIRCHRVSAVDFTEDAPASFTDDLSAVLDDATNNDDATNGATIDGETFSLA